MNKQVSKWIRVGEHGLRCQIECVGVEERGQSRCVGICVHGEVGPSAEVLIDSSACPDPQELRVQAGTGREESVSFAEAVPGQLLRAVLAVAQALQVDISTRGLSGAPSAALAAAPLESAAADEQREGQGDDSCHTDHHHIDEPLSGLGVRHLIGGEDDTLLLPGHQAPHTDARHILGLRHQPMDGDPGFPRLHNYPPHVALPKDCIEDTKGGCVPGLGGLPHQGHTLVSVPYHFERPHHSGLLGFHLPI